MIKYICGKCKRETSPPKGFSFVECGNCGYITPGNKARVEVPDIQPAVDTIHRKDDQTFNDRHLLKRGALALGLDPDNTSWFEVVGELEKVMAKKEEQL